MSDIRADEIEVSSSWCIAVLFSLQWDMRNTCRMLMAGVHIVHPKRSVPLSAYSHNISCAIADSKDGGEVQDQDGDECGAEPLER